MPIDYTGEHLLHGQLGNALVIVAFTCACLSALAYAVSARQNANSANWKKIARISFYTHSASVAGCIGMLFWMLGNHYFEFHYVWQHSNSEMPMRYLLSSFWEGQEGSFLLWIFWHVLLGNILLRTARSWEAPVMAVFSSVQIFLVSMLLGIYIFDYKIGSNPFTLLLREHPDFAGIPLFANPNYLASLDGRGLNPLLQNYWMTIHPPTLFLGFASTLVPFCFAVAALWNRSYNEWLKPALPWAFFGVMILGTGILMGGAWAYEALSFGGFWAWDPVENASLVPWLTFVGAAHLMLVQRNKGTSLFSLFFLTLITFVLILYSTFLTRSGVLGDASVHAFTDLGMSGQLLIYLFFFLGLSVFLLVINYRHFPKNKAEETTWSREFWMFIGALVLFVSAFQIIFTTSIPVVNKVFGTSLAPPPEPVEHYNAWQIPFAIIVALLIGFGQFLNYKQTEFRLFLKKITYAIFFALLLTGLIAYALNFFKPLIPHYILLLFASLFAVGANLDYFLRVLKGRIKHAGASIAHIGMGLILLGALISTGKSEIISQNTSGVDVSSLDTIYKNNENILLFKNDTLQMGSYHITYKGKRQEGVNIFYEVEYLHKNEAGSFASAFTLYPRVQTNPRMGNVAEPDTRHFLSKDIYTHVTYAELSEERPEEGFMEPNTKLMGRGDTLFASNSIIILDSLVKNINKEMHQLYESDIAVGAALRAIDVQGNHHPALPLFVLRDTSFVVPFPNEVKQLGLKFTFTRIDTESGRAEISVQESTANRREFIIMKAIVFPYINVLWLGCILLVLGTVTAVVSRIRRANR